jgi:hypothetical protein
MNGEGRRIEEKIREEERRKGKRRKEEKREGWRRRIWLWSELVQHSYPGHVCNQTRKLYQVKLGRPK